MTDNNNNARNCAWPAIKSKEDAKVTVKQEDDAQNDSGINSGSEPSSSPNSDYNNDFNNTYTCLLSQVSPRRMLNPAIASTSTAHASGQNAFNNVFPPTPPGSEPVGSPSSTTTQQSHGHSENEDRSSENTPVASPRNTNNIELMSACDVDSLRRLRELATSGNSTDEDNKSGDEQQQSLDVPRMNSHGKLKSHKCKQCEFVAYTKNEFWKHTRIHIKADKLLTCPKCPFVTEYKHHLEYHMRNHVGSKPFKCPRCNYTCVNKSMLNSHMKSHSNIYQYRCFDCSYASKYVHSLKQHLRKYNHRPGPCLNPDGSVNPAPVIDVYGTRRGPKQKPPPSMIPTETAQTNIIPNFAQMLLNAQNTQLPFPYHLLGAFPGALENALLFTKALSQLNMENSNLSNNGPRYADDADPGPSTSTGTYTSATVPSEADMRLRQSSPDSSDSEMEDEVLDLSLPTPPPSQQPKKLPVKRSHKENESTNKPPHDNHDNTTCPNCNITFGDQVLYSMHMGYHGFREPFTCNMCGEKCEDKVKFFLHIARHPH